MTKVRRFLFLMVALCSTLASAATTDEAENVEVAKSLHIALLRSFALDTDLKIDPALRTAADELSAAHVARIDQLLPAWLAEERQAQSKAAAGKAPGYGQVFFAVWARMLNELALWQVEPGDADYERATLAALQSSPRLCFMAGDSRHADFASRIVRIQAMPADQRAAALATERRLLSRWGQARGDIAAWPDPLPQDAGGLWRKRPASAGERPVQALPPVLAHAILVEKKSYESLHPQLKCAVQQWWLQVSLKQGATQAAALNAFRYGTLIGAADRFDIDERVPADGKPASAGAPAYPGVAARFLVTGVTTMRARLDAAGKPVQASVAERKIDVPGIRGVRPVAFENVFDAAAVTYALGGYRYDQQRGADPVVLKLVWSLPEDGAADKKTGGGQ